MRPDVVTLCVVLLLLFSTEDGMDLCGCLLVGCLIKSNSIFNHIKNGGKVKGGCLQFVYHLSCELCKVFLSRWRKCSFFSNYLVYGKGVDWFLVQSVKVTFLLEGNIFNRRLASFSLLTFAERLNQSVPSVG